MRANKEIIRWVINIEDTRFSIYDIEGGKFNLSLCNEGFVLGTYNSAEDAAAALPSFEHDSQIGHLLIGKIVPGQLAAWIPDPR